MSPLQHTPPSVSGGPRGQPAPHGQSTPRRGQSTPRGQSRSGSVNGHNAAMDVAPPPRRVQANGSPIPRNFSTPNMRSRASPSPSPSPSQCSQINGRSLLKQRNISSPVQNRNGQSNWNGRTVSPYNRRNPLEAMSGIALQDFRSISVVLEEVPNEISTWDIYKSLVTLVDVVRVDIHEHPQGGRKGRATVIVEPAPKRWPWSQTIPVDRPDSRPIHLHYHFGKLKQADRTMRSPLNNVIPVETTIFPSGICFGMMIKDSTMMEMHRVHSNDIKISAHFGGRKLAMTFSVDLGDEARPKVCGHKTIIKFSHLKKLFRVARDNGGWSLIIPLPSPPRFYRQGDIEMSHDSNNLVWSENDSWLRQINITKDPRAFKDLPATLNQEKQLIDIGRWTTYCLHMKPETLDNWKNIEKYLRDFNIKTQEVSDFSFVTPDGTNFWSLMDTPESQGTADSALVLLGLNLAFAGLPFEVRYQLEACISHGIFNEYNVDAQFLTTLGTYEPDRARMMLECVVENKKPIYNPMSIFKDDRVLHYWPNTRLPSYCTIVRKAVVTPTTIYVKTPTVEMTNRILRQYSSLGDRFLRVQFTDELTEGRISPCADSKKDNEVFTRVFRVLQNGIVIGDRHYKFLAFGNSQFRENGAYFFCPTTHTTCESIREWMGDLTGIRCVGKYAARMGQCFTTTRQLSGMTVPQIRTIPDIEYHGFTFTDGVGKISKFLADIIATERDLPEAPSCIQFRMGGCKGIYTVWPDVPFREVQIRPSQEKFKAVYNGLEIIKTSSFSSATLNRQTITILSTLGVDDVAFEDLLTDQLQTYDEAMNDPTKAKVLLTTQVDENQMTVTIAEMIQAGFMDHKDPFLWTLLRLWRTWSLKLLKEKARIVVEKGAFLLGCVDEAGVLRGHSAYKERFNSRDIESLPQIFLQVPDGGRWAREKGIYKVITGLCIVGRNPSLHPGDIRVVQAVDVRELRHLKDVVVFPQKGDRDIPSMCSGGDLDGDDFFVFWDERLLPREWNYPPMLFDTMPAKQIPEGEKGVTMRHLASFFVQYMKNDSLPRIAHAHLASADRLDGHAKNPACLELAQLHSTAVDYVKSGNEARMPKRLAPRQWPHFMEKKGSTYRSEEVLGRLYDRVQRTEFKPAYEMKFDKRILKRYTLDNDILKKARHLKSKYDTAMRRLMGQYEIETEFEIFSTFVLSKPRVGSDYKMQETIGREAAALKQRFKDVCREAAGITERFSDPEKLDPFVAAMYTVTSEEVKIALHESRVPQISSSGQQFYRKLNANSMPLISFPWIFHRELGRIACGRMVKLGLAPLPLMDMIPQPKPKPEARDGDAGEENGEAGVGDASALSLNSEQAGDIDYVRTADGQIIHRGEVLNLFNDDDSDDEDGSIGGEGMPPAEPFEAKREEEASDKKEGGGQGANSPVAPPAAAPPPPAAASDDEEAEVEFEEVDDESEEANALGLLTNKLQN